MKDLKQVNENIIDMLEDLDERLGKISDDDQNSEQLATKDIEDQPVEIKNDEVPEFFAKPTDGKLAKIQQTIFRIGNRSYGVCLICGKEIKKGGLKTVLFLKRCTECAEKKDGN